MAARRRRRARQPKKSASVVITIDDIARSGVGVGRDNNGRAVFVPFTAPGDVVRIHLNKVKQRFAEGVLEEILDFSPIRIDARCPVYTQCGGCQWQHIPYDLQWKTKEAGVRGSLGLAKVVAPENWDSFPAHQIWAYRNRVQLRGQGSDIGFYARQTNTLVPIQGCDIVHPAINEVLNDVREEGAQFSEPYKVELNLTLDGEVLRTWNSPHSASGFRQVNDEQNVNLQEWIKATLKPAAGILDLYGGAGNLSLPLRDIANEIHCVDLNIPQSSDVAVPALFHFHQSPVLPWLQNRVAKLKGKHNEAAGNEWRALIDPPRGGLGDECLAIIEGLAALKVDTVILVGCKTDPWARDLSRFIEQGWRLEKVAVFDFFPQTFHVESVAMLVKNQGKNKRKQQ